MSLSRQVVVGTAGIYRRLSRILRSGGAEMEVSIGLRPALRTVARASLCNRRATKSSDSPQRGNASRTWGICNNNFYAENGHTLRGSFSAVSKPMFATKYSSDSSRPDLHNALHSSVLKPLLLFFNFLINVSESLLKLLLKCCQKLPN